MEPTTTTTDAVVSDTEQMSSAPARAMADTAAIAAHTVTSTTAVTATEPCTDAARPPVHILVLLDASGSMQKSKQKALDALNAALSEAKKDGHEDQYTLLSFNHELHVMRSRQRVSDFLSVMEQEYETNGITCLYASVERALLEYTGSNMLLFIVTDGMDTGSPKPYTSHSMHAAISKAVSGENVHVRWLCDNDKGAEREAARALAAVLAACPSVDTSTEGQQQGGSSSSSSMSCSDAGSDLTSSMRAVLQEGIRRLRVQSSSSSSGGGDGGAAGGLAHAHVLPEHKEPRAATDPDTASAGEPGAAPVMMLGASVNRNGSGGEGIGSSEGGSSSGSSRQPGLTKRKTPPAAEVTDGFDEFYTGTY